MAVLSPISVPLEPEPELEDVVIELTPEPMFPGAFPFPIHYLERNVLWVKRDILNTLV